MALCSVTQPEALNPTSEWFTVTEDRCFQEALVTSFRLEEIADVLIDLSSNCFGLVNTGSISIVLRDGKVIVISSMAAAEAHRVFFHLRDA
jgi:hypothetical protein